jgi:hypothetical protein
MENNTIEQQMIQLGVLQNPVYPNTNLIYPNSNLINPKSNPIKPTGNSNPVNPSSRPVNNFQQNTTKIAQLGEQGQQAKRELAILVATGKSEDLAGRIQTFQYLDNMLE